MIKLKEIIGKDLPPPYQHLEDENSELEMALKSPWAAWEFAQRNGPNPKLFAVIKGSPFESHYIRKFGR